MARVSFQIDSDYDQRQHQRPDTRDALLRYTERAAEEARRFAPVLTGLYRDSISVVDAGRRGLVLRVRDAKWHWIEYGSKNNRPSAPLRRGVEAAGFQFDTGRRGAKS